MDHDVSAGLDHAEAETAARSDVRHRASGAPLPAQIGPYHIIELLGQGGMGAVYLAEQTQPFRRRVAVKVIKPGMDSEQVIARFETERQALALMNHPNVARVLDAGTTADGRPYFVMEHVAGIPITDYCDRHTLSTRERLDLFLSVFAALLNTHQKGIIHRDLKPSNVLVTLQNDAPTPKVIDFGIAKAVEQRLTDRTLFTEFGQLLGTPEYMSPEQAEMTTLDIDTRRDIYSLGVLLYELLVGALPFERKALRRAAALEVQRILSSEDPLTPSTRLSSLGEGVAAVAAARRSRLDHDEGAREGSNAPVRNCLTARRRHRALPLIPAGGRRATDGQVPYPEVRAAEPRRGHRRGRRARGACRGPRREQHPVPAGRTRTAARRHADAHRKARQRVPDRPVRGVEPGRRTGPRGHRPRAARQGGGFHPGPDGSTRRPGDADGHDGPCVPDARPVRPGGRSPRERDQNPAAAARARQPRSGGLHLQPGIRARRTRRHP